MNLPPTQKIANAWYGHQVQSKPHRWTVQLNDRDVTELSTAAARYLARSNNIANINKANFSLPGLQDKIANLKETLINGTGFALVRGLDRSRYTVQELAVMFYGLGAHLGNARMQNSKGHVLGHVRDLSLNSVDPNVRVYQTNERQSFHTDSTDVVALLCLNTAKSGGESLLVSAVTVFNEMRETCPEHLEYLFDPVATDRRGEIPEGMLPYFSIPVFTWFKNHLNVIYQRQYIDSAQRFDNAFKLTGEHVQALDKFDELCNDPDINLTMNLEPGDMQFVYNHSLLHDRNSFVDYQQPEDRRHLLRLWLSIPGDRELPEVFCQRFESVEIGARGGMHLNNVVPCAPLQAE